MGSQLNFDPDLGREEDRYGYNWVLVCEKEVQERDRTSIPISDVVFNYCDEYYHQIFKNLYRQPENPSYRRDSITNNGPLLQGMASGDGGRLVPGNEITEDTVDPVVQMTTPTEPERNRADLITISHVIRDIQMLAKTWLSDVYRYLRQQILNFHRQQQNQQNRWQEFNEVLQKVLIAMLFAILLVNVQGRLIFGIVKKLLRGARIENIGAGILTLAVNTFVSQLLSSTHSSVNG